MASDDDNDEDDVEDVSDDDDDDDNEDYNIDDDDCSDDDDDGDNDDNELNEGKGEVHHDGEGNQKTLWIIPCKFLFFSPRNTFFKGSNSFSYGCWGWGEASISELSMKIWYVKIDKTITGEILSKQLTLHSSLLSLEEWKRNED